MSTTPTEPGGTHGPGMGGITPGMWGGARMPIPGNAELAVFLIVWVIIAIIWAASDAVDAHDFVMATTALTFAYLISRGIAKASRVLEQ